MPGSVRTEGLARFKQKLLARMPQAAREEMRKANQKTANEFEARVRQIIPRGDPARGHLLDSLKQEAGQGVAVLVSIGDAAHPYPLHLEAGHKAADGSHVPARPAWNPAKRLARKKHRARAARALRAAVKITAGAG